MPDVAPLEIDVAYDAAVFGTDRSALLFDLARKGGASVKGGYAFERPGSNAAFLGPWVAESSDAAEVLLRWFVARHSAESTAIDLFPHHPHAVRMASALGFKPFRRLTRMVLKPNPVVLPDPRIYGIAGFEWG
jgi:hypothetical protein